MCAAFLDLRKAVDSLDHHALLQRLINLGVSGTEIEIILVIECDVSSVEMFLSGGLSWGYSSGQHPWPSYFLFM